MPIKYHISRKILKTLALVQVCLRLLQLFSHTVSWFLPFLSLFQVHSHPQLSFINLINLFHALCIQGIIIQSQLTLKLQSSLQTAGIYLIVLILFKVAFLNILARLLLCIASQSHCICNDGLPHHRQIFGWLSLLVVHTVIREFISQCAWTAGSPKIFADRLRIHNTVKGGNQLETF